MNMIIKNISLMVIPFISLVSQAIESEQLSISSGSFVLSANDFPRGCDLEVIKESQATVSSWQVNELKKIVCEVFTADASDTDLVKEWLQRLAEVQIKGLTPSAQNFANLLAGNLSCQLAKERLSRLNPGRNGLMDQTFFCSARKRASARYNDIVWGANDFKIIPKWIEALDHRADDHGGSFPEGLNDLSLLNEYAACYADDNPLSSQYDDSCGLGKRVSDQKIESMISEVSDEVNDKYLSSDKSNYISGMFARKQSRVQDVVSEADEKLKALKDDLSGVNSDLDRQEKDFKGVDSEVIALSDQYRSAAQEILAVSRSLKDWFDDLMSADANAGISSSRENITSAKESLKSVHETLKSIETQMPKLVSDTGIKSPQMLEACQLYYCVLQSRMRIDVSADYSYRYHELVGFRCDELSELKDNVLCSDSKEKSAVLYVDTSDGKQTSATVQELCLAAGLDESWAKLRLHTKKARVCSAELSGL